MQLQNNRANDINTEFVAINSSYSPDKKVDYSAFLILTNSETEIQQNNSTQYVGLTENIPDENTQTNTSQVSELGIGKFSLKFIPTFFYIGLNFILKYFFYLFFVIRNLNFSI